MPKSQQQRSTERLNQKQRSDLRKKLDIEDSIACAERANNCCEVCGLYRPYEPNSIYSGSMHHGRKKRTEEDRRNRMWHIWLCNCHHTLAHASDGQIIRAACELVIEEREQ